jgi:hypothetical protein
MESIHTLIKSFDRLAEKYGHRESYLALKKHYSDTCSNGDVIINELIDGLHSNNNNYYHNLLIDYKDDYEFINRLINEYLIETINEFMEKGLKPDPFWVEKAISEYLANQAKNK